MRVDLSASPAHTQLLFDTKLLDVLLLVITQPHSDRLIEVALGTCS